MNHFSSPDADQANRSSRGNLAKPLAMLDKIAVAHGAGAIWAMGRATGDKQDADIYMRDGQALVSILKAGGIRAFAVSDPSARAASKTTPAMEFVVVKGDALAALTPQMEQKTLETIAAAKQRPALGLARPAKGRMFGFFG